MLTNCMHNFNDDDTIKTIRAMPSDIMMSVHFDWVTNARASNDYAMTSNLVEMPAAGLLMWSLGIRPSKDNFWTTNATGSPYKGGGANPGTNVELNTIVAALSTGPVGISDKIGATNATLIMATCTADGDLLQTTKPLTPTDRSFVWQLQSGTAAGTPPCESYGSQYMWNSYSAIETVVHAWYTVGVNMKTSNSSDKFLLSPEADFYPAPGEQSSSADAAGPSTSAVYEDGSRHGGAAEKSAMKLVHRNWHAGNRCTDGVQDAVAAGCIYGNVPSMSPSTVRSNGNGQAAFDLIVSYPVLQTVTSTPQLAETRAAAAASAAASHSWVFMGELDKYVSVSSRRFSNVQVASNSLQVTVSGSTGENVSVAVLKSNAANTWRVVVEDAVVGSQGKVDVIFSA